MTSSLQFSSLEALWRMSINSSHPTACKKDAQMHSFLSFRPVLLNMYLRDSSLRLLCTFRNYFSDISSVTMQHQLQRDLVKSAKSPNTNSNGNLGISQRCRDSALKLVFLFHRLKWNHCFRGKKRLSSLFLCSSPYPQITDVALILHLNIPFTQWHV